MGISDNISDKKNLIHTSLYDLHIKHGGKVIDFASYALPIYYKGIIAEHLHTRKKASLFDVSHMGQIIIRGEDFISSAKMLETIIPTDISYMKKGEMRYCLLLNEDGNIVDDLIITRPTEEQGKNGEIFLVVNGATKRKDINFLQENIGKELDIHLQQDKSLIALQGPYSSRIINRLGQNVENLFFMNSMVANIAGIEVNISRSGYSGEDGFEISLKNESAAKLAAILLNEAEVEFGGLGARDSLRLEAGLCLYGQDIDENIDPISASLSFTISKRRKIEGGFLGGDKILALLKNGPKKKRIAIKFEGPIPVRSGAKLINKKGEEIGYISSGAFSPILQAPIAMGYLPTKNAKIGAKVLALVRNRQIEGKIVKMPFIANKYYRKI